MNGYRRCDIDTHTHTHTHTYTHTQEYYSAIKKNEILPFATIQLDSEDSIGEISQTGKDKYYITYM